LKNLLTQIDAAANQHDVKAVMQFYGENFSHSDGLSRQYGKGFDSTLAALSKSEVPDTTAILKSEGMRLWQKRLLLLPAFSLETAGISFRATIRSRQR